MTAIKHDIGKRQWDLLPFDAVAKVVEVLEFGAKKYEPRNWEKGFDYTRIFNSLQRHLVAWIGGEDTDPETGLSHMAHAACNTLFLLAFIERRVGKDDRPCQEPKESLLTPATIENSLLSARVAEFLGASPSSINTAIKGEEFKAVVETATASDMRARSMANTAVPTTQEISQLLELGRELLENVKFYGTELTFSQRRS